MDKNNLITLAKDVYRLTLLFPNREPLRYRMREIADDMIAELIMEKNDYLGNLDRNLELIDSYFQVALDQDWTSPARICGIKNSYARIKEEISETIVKKEKESGEICRSLKKNLSPSNTMADSVIICPPAKELEKLKGNEAPVRIETSEEKINLSEPEMAIIEDMPLRTVPDVVLEKQDVEAEEDEESGEEGSGGTLSASQITRQNRIVEFLKEKGSAQVWEIQKIFPQVSKRTIRRDFRAMLKQGLIERTGERNTTAYKLKINIS